MLSIAQMAAAAAEASKRGVDCSTEYVVVGDESWALR
jgi:hypothetical protein